MLEEETQLYYRPCITCGHTEKVEVNNQAVGIVNTMYRREKYKIKAIIVIRRFHPTWTLKDAKVFVEQNWPEHFDVCRKYNDECPTCTCTRCR
jgi:hypothetical protein